MTAEAEDACVARSREVAVTTAYLASDSRPLGSNGDGEAQLHGASRRGRPVPREYEEVAAPGYEGFAPTASAVTS